MVNSFNAFIDKITFFLMLINISQGCMNTPTPEQPVDPPTCAQITTDADVILSQTGVLNVQDTVTVSCPAGQRVQLGNTVLASGATATLTCVSPGYTDGTTEVTEVSCEPECAQITTGADVILTPTGSQVNGETVMVSCPTGKRLRLNDVSQASGATATLTCTAPDWITGGTTITSVTCDPECQQVTTTPDVTVDPPGPQLELTPVTFTCPAGMVIKLDNTLLTTATTQLGCVNGMWTNTVITVTMVSCAVPCPSAAWVRNENFGACYLVVKNSPVTYAGAQTACTATTGAFLTTVNSQAESDFLTSIATNNVPGTTDYPDLTWIGVKQIPANSNTWVNEQTGTTVPFPIPWSPGQPDNPTIEDCIQLIQDSLGAPNIGTTGQWQNYGCAATSAQYICKFPL